MDLRSERDIERLRAAALLQEAEFKRVLGVLKTKCDEVDELRGRRGSFQEVFDLLKSLRDQAKADGQVASAPADVQDTPKPPQRGHGPTPQPKLRREPQLFELDEPDRTCPCCGRRLEAMAGQYEESEMVDVEIDIVLVEVKRQKYRCACGGAVETAPGPERATEGGRFSLRCGAKAVTDKYDLHLPLDRQSRAYKSLGLDVSKTTLWDQVYALAHDLRPTYGALKDALLAEEVIGLDQTGWKSLGSKGGKPHQMWCLTSERAVFHAIRDDKSAATFRDLLGAYPGIIVCDALSTHLAASDGTHRYRIAHCWAHVMRRFKEAVHDFPAARTAIDLIRELYALEDRAKSAAHRAELRTTESRRVLDALEGWLRTYAAIRGTELWKAIRYTLGIWDGLKIFVEHPGVWLDNNRTERGLRGPVVGRKNHYGSKSRRGTEVASIHYSLLETARLHGVNPTEYIVEAVRAGRRGEILLPWQMAG